MKDRLLFGTIGLLVGVVVMQWTVTVPGRIGSVQASMVDHGATGIVAQDGPWCLDQNGNVWISYLSDPPVPTGTCWQAHTSWNPPMPVSEIKFWSHESIITTSDHEWSKQGTNDPWVDCGAWPGVPLATEQSTWGKIKSTFSPKGDKP